MATKTSTASKTTSSTAKKSNQNYSTSLANGGSVTVKNGVKTYSDKPLQVRGNNGISISGQSYSVNKGGSGYAPISVDAAGKVITAESLKPTEKINLPNPAPVDGLFGVTDGINASLAGMGGATYDTTKKQIVAPTPANPQEDKFQSLVQQYMGANSAAFNEMPSSVDRLKEQQKMLRPKENIVNSLQSQINTIVANRDAEMLSLEGQGRGISESIIGGQQAQISREAAIRSLPIQAQLAAAQDDLESARSYASQLFQAQSQDALAKYNYQKELNSSIFNFLNEKEKRVVAANEKANDRAFSIEQSNRDTLKSLSLQALEYGQGALAAEAMKLNPSSPTFDQDYGDIMSRLRKPVAAVERETEMFGSKLIDTQTGEVIKDFGGDLVGGATADEMAYAQQYASTGQIPTGLSTAGVSFGRIQELAADLPKPNGALVSTPTGVAPSTLNDTQKAGIVAMSEIVNETLPNMQKLWDEAQRTNLGGTGIVGGLASKVIPSQAMTRYLQARDEFLSKLLVARSGAAVTEPEYDRYAALVPSSFNGSLFLGSGGNTKLEGLQNLMTTDLDNKLNASDLSIYGYSKVKAGDDTYTVGEIVTNEYGQSGRINPDGSITLIN